MYKSGFDPTVNVRLRHSFSGGHCRRGGTRCCQGRELHSRRRSRCCASLTTSIPSPNSPPRYEWQVVISSGSAGNLKSSILHVKASFFKPGFQNTGRQAISTSSKHRRLSRFVNASPIPSCKRRRIGIERLFTPQHGKGDAGELVGQSDDSGVLCMRARSARNHPPSGVSLLESVGRTALAPWIRSLRRWQLPRLVIPARRGLPPVVICRGTRPSHAARSRPRANVRPSPIAAERAVAFSTPMPGMVARRRALSSFFARDANSSSKAAMRRSRTRHSSRMSSISRRIRGLTLRPFSSPSIASSSRSRLRPLRDDRAPLQENCTQLIDQGRALPHQPAGAMQRLHVQLLFTFQLGETHGRPCGCLSNASASRSSFFCALTEGRTYSGDISRTSWPCALMRLKTAEMVGATARLHRDDARGQPFGKTNDARRSHPPPLDDALLSSSPTRLQ